MLQNNNGTERLEKMYINMYLIFMILSLSSIGIIAYTSYLIDMPVLKLWKELYIFIMFVISIYLLVKRKRKKVITFIMIILSIYSIWFFYSVFSIDLHQVIYQIKLDGFNILFFVNTITVFSICKNKYEKEELIQKIFKIIIIFALINSVFIIFQGLFSDFFVTKILGIEWGAWSRDYGISVVVADDKLRALGLMNNYISAGELLVISIILIMEGKNIFKLDKNKKALILFVLLIGIYFTTYKTAYLWIAVYILVKVIAFILNKIDNKHIKKISSYIKMSYVNASLVFSTIFLLILQWIVTNTLILYGLIEKLVPKFAYTSVYLRVILHQEVISNMKSIPQKILGLGMGLNGIFAGNPGAITTNTIALDSSYIYILSNYGILGLILYIVTLVGLMALSVVYNDKDEWGIKYLISYLLCIQFFFNNLSTSIPISYISIIFMVAFISNIEGLKIKSLKKEK